jgi:hypothetical protein
VFIRYVRVLMSWGANHCASELDLGAGPVRFWGTEGCLSTRWQPGGCVARSRAWSREKSKGSSWAAAP